MLLIKWPPTMNQNLNKIVQKIKQHRIVPTVSAVLPDVDLLEMVHDPVRNETRFVIYHDAQWRFENELTIDPTSGSSPTRPTTTLSKMKSCSFRPSRKNTLQKSNRLRRCRVSFT